MTETQFKDFTYQFYLQYRYTTKEHSTLKSHRHQSLLSMSLCSAKITEQVQVNGLVSHCCKGVDLTWIEMTSPAISSNYCIVPTHNLIPCKDITLSQGLIYIDIQRGISPVLSPVPESSPQHMSLLSCHMLQLNFLVWVTVRFIGAH